MKKRIWAILTALLLAVSLIMGCSGSSGSGIAGSGSAISGTAAASATTAFQSDTETAFQNDATTAFQSDTETAFQSDTETASSEDLELLDEYGSYNSKDEVALYIYQYGHLPDNYISKKEAEKMGWSGGSLEKYAPGCAIGGSRFGNYEGRLPDKKGRSYTECDIDTIGRKSRGAKRIVFSNDGLIYYTEDHYEHFELLYGEE